MLSDFFKRLFGSKDEEQDASISDLDKKTDELSVLFEGLSEQVGNLQSDVKNLQALFEHISFEADNSELEKQSKRLESVRQDFIKFQSKVNIGIGMVEGKVNQVKDELLAVSNTNDVMEEFNQSLHDRISSLEVSIANITEAIANWKGSVNGFSKILIDNNKRIEAIENNSADTKSNLLLD